MQAVWNLIRPMNFNRKYAYTAIILLAISAIAVLSPVNIFPEEAQKTFRADFRDKDVGDFLKAMSAIIGKNIVADDKIKGNITVISPKKINVIQAEAYLKSVLAVKGFGVIEEKGNVLRIVPLKDAVAMGQIIFYGREEIDQQVDKKEPVTVIIPLHSLNATSISNVLRKLTTPDTIIVNYDEIDALVLAGGSYEINHLIKIVNAIDLPGEKDPKKRKNQNVHFIRLKNLDALEVEKTLNKLTMPALADEGGDNKEGGNATPPANKNDKIMVVAHKESNSIIFVGSYAEFSVVQNIVELLDTERDQVLLEVLIVEVEADDNNSFGIDWRIRKDGEAQFNSGLAAEGGVYDTKGDLTGINTLLGFSLGVLKGGSNSVMGILNANMQKENFAIISAPQILTLDNQEAEINVGQDIPVRTAQRTSGAGDQTVSVDQYEYRPVGIKLVFTPSISKNREGEKLITLKLYQEVKAIAGSTSDTTANPRFTKKDIKTVIKTRNRQTIVIGGLVSTDKTNSVRKIPLLGDIPVLGYLFKRNSTVLKKTNLLVFITPHILTNKEIADRVTQDSIERQGEEIRARERRLQ